MSPQELTTYAEALLGPIILLMFVAAVLYLVVRGILGR